MKHTVNIKRFAFLFTLTLVAISMQAQTQTVKHVVDRGETLESIAKTYNTSIDEIIGLNPNAAQFIYVGMELTIPSNNDTAGKLPSYDATDLSGNQESFSNSEYSHSQSAFTRDNELSEPQEDLNNAFACIGWSSGTFKNLKTSGRYGVDLVFFLSHFKHNMSLGFNLSLANLNYGLVDKHFVSDLIKVGPAIRYQVNKNIFIVLPLDVCCNITFEKQKKDESGQPITDKDGKPQYQSGRSCAWGMMISPNLYLGTQDFGVYIGPNMNLSFESAGKPGFGFQAGIYFGK